MLDTKYGHIFLFLLAVQVGVAPILNQKLLMSNVASGENIDETSSINKRSIVLTCELVKILISSGMLVFNNQLTLLRKFDMTRALLPSCLYAVQNMLVLQGISVLSPVVFNVLNQTKTISTALCCYILLGKKQSRMQIFALALLFSAALIMEGYEASLVDRLKSLSTLRLSLELIDLSTVHDRIVLGILPVLGASLLSGISGTISQHLLANRNVHLFSIELCACSIVILSTSLAYQKDELQALKGCLAKLMFSKSFIVILNQSVGGILVGLVTKYLGAVKKSFGIIFGIALTVIFQSIFCANYTRVGANQYAGCILAAISLFLHSSFPFQTTEAVKRKND